MTPAPDAGPDAAEAWDDLLRAEFTRAAHDVTPGPAPVAAVVRAGRVRRRRRTVALSVLAVLGVSAAVAAGTALAGDPHPAAGLAAPPFATTASASAASASAASPATPRTPGTPRTSATVPRIPTPVRTVAAGERVEAAPGWTVWLTARGKYWEGGEDGMRQFRPVDDGNIDLRSPGVSFQGEGAFRSGLYYGTRDVGRVDLVDAKGRTTTAVLLELAGRPGWGVWYAVTPDASSMAVRLYDRAERLLSDLPRL
ncbi:hypothetical protein ACFWIN_12480 [Streptomyces sp. NPDC127049]|uniref:hypothetical protein n=1 Tax=Streptomyces sp. NPDC127049 TaxID=3347118 RepID=UPI00364B2C8B